MSTQTAAQLPEVRVLEGENPFDVPPEAEFLGEPPDEAPLWGETVFFLVWDPAQSVGFWIHMGVLPEDQRMWWAQTFALLPGGQVVADRSFGRAADNRGPESGNLKVKVVEPLSRWKLVFDGAGELTTTDAMAAGPVGAGVAAPLSFDVELEALVPPYDMHGAFGKTNMDWKLGGLHIEQGHRARGTMSANGQSWDIDGISIRDHSRGERNFEHSGGHSWNYILWPESRRAMCSMVMWRPGPEKEVLMSVAMLMEDGKTEIFPDFTITGKTEAGGYPRQLELSCIRADGSRLDLRGEVVHNATMSYANPNHNINGNWSDPGYDLGDPLIADESVIRWVWPDGEVGWAMMERAYRSSILPCPTAPLMPGSAFE